VLSRPIDFSAPRAYDGPLSHVLKKIRNPNEGIGMNRTIALSIVSAAAIVALDTVGIIKNGIDLSRSWPYTFSIVALIMGYVARRCQRVVQAKMQTAPAAIRTP